MNKSLSFRLKLGLYLIVYVHFVLTWSEIKIHEVHAQIHVYVEKFHSTNVPQTCFLF